MLIPCHGCKNPGELIHTAVGAGDTVDRLRQIERVELSSMLMEQFRGPSSQADAAARQDDHRGLLASCGVVCTKVDEALKNADATVCDPTTSACDKLQVIRASSAAVRGEILRIADA